MPNTTGITTSDNLAVKQWNDQAYREFLSQLPASQWMGTDVNALIQVKEDLMKKAGDAVTFGLIGALEGAGVSGDSVLEGNEEAISTYSQQVVVNQFRNAVRTTGVLSEQRYPFEIRNELKPSLLDWKAQTDEDRIFAAMGAIDGTAYTAASESAKDSWLTNNSDRVLFGAAVANASSLDHSTSLGNVDGSTDILNCAHLTLAKRLAKLCDPKIRPIKISSPGASMEVFVYFAHPYATRDLKSSSEWNQAQRDALPRSFTNPLFTGGWGGAEYVGMYDGIIVIETERVLLLDNVGNGSCDVSQNFLCGAQAVLWAQGGIMGQRMKSVEEQFDYENQVGVSIASIYGVQKARFATGAAGVSKDHGIVTCYTAAVAD